MKDASCWVVVIACLVLAGCPRPEEPVPDQVRPNGVPPVPDEPPPPTWVGEMTLEVADWDRVEEIVAEHEGRVVVVHVWASWCDRCRDEFDGLVALQRRYGDRVAAVSVNADYAGEEERPPEAFVDDVRSFLEARDARFQNVISSVPDEALYERLEIPFPSVLVYDRDGALHTRIVQDDEAYEEDFSYQRHVLPEVQRLLEVN